MVRILFPPPASLSHHCAARAPWKAPARSRVALTRRRWEMNRQAPAGRRRAFFRVCSPGMPTVPVSARWSSKKAGTRAPAAQQWRFFSPRPSGAGGKVAPKTAIPTGAPGALLDPTCQGTISAQPGPQTSFCKPAADICIYGRRRGWREDGSDLILEPLRHVGRVANLPRYSSAVPRPNHQSRWLVGREPKLLSAARWHRAPASARMALATRRQDQVFASQLGTTVLDWQGAQITLSVSTS